MKESYSIVLDAVFGTRREVLEQVTLPGNVAGNIYSKRCSVRPRLSYGAAVTSLV